ncbi:MAG TPA: exonuclease SbcCD subunit D C-terminal domain-containing protein [Myxococcota bacterium]|nr:exonuclease SbcCD subunit D C-terminal domain-containing protein [Myxococcota bacterium]
MRILHTSDWHLGARLHTKSRLDEQLFFLEWLHDLIADQSVDALVVAGDIFDTAIPATGVQGAWLDFLVSLRDTGCRHVVAIGGNHDSFSLLNAWSPVLKFLNVHVVGGVSESIDDQVLVLRDQAGLPELIVGAVPFLREADVSRSVAGETPSMALDRIAQGIADYYEGVRGRIDVVHAELVERHGAETVAGSPPVVLTGHLFVEGYLTAEGERRLYVGNLGAVSDSIFPGNADYVALGHLHKAQRIRNDQTIRYSGSPLQLGFDEAGENKFVYLVDFVGPSGTPATVQHVQVPVWHHMAVISEPDIQSIVDGLKALDQAGEPVWADVRYVGEAPEVDLRGKVSEAVEGGVVDVLRIGDKYRARAVIQADQAAEPLEQYSPERIFQLRLDAETLTDEQKAKLILLHERVVHSLQSPDDVAGVTGAEGGAR